MDREGPMEFDGRSLVEYASAIRGMVEAHNAVSGDLARYLDSRETPGLGDKVVSIVPSVEVVDDALMGCAVVKLREPLTAEETAALCSYLTGQYSDGWGESFEQAEIGTGDGVLFVHFWNREDFQIEIDRYPAVEEEKAPEPAPRETLRPKMDLVGMDGNIFAILGTASRLLHRAGQAEQAREMVRRVEQAPDYHRALWIISEYVETELSGRVPDTRSGGEKENPRRKAPER